MTTRVVLVRHAETVWHAENRYAGSTDIEITDRGREQRDDLATWARDAGLSGVWSSPLRRARESAEPSAMAAGVELHVDTRLRELDFGIAEGLTRAELWDRHPDAREAFEADPVGHYFPEGEDPHAAVQRYQDALADLVAQHPDGRVLVVAHSTAIRLTLCRLLGFDLADYRVRFPSLANCALTEISFDGERVALMSYNNPVTGVSA